MQDDRTFSVVTVTYWTGPTLSEQVRSVLAQEHLRDFIVVDNGNPPNYTAWLQAQARLDPRMTVMVGHGNPGYAAGCNMGARQAAGEVLMFLNPDCRLPADALKRLDASRRTLNREWILGCRLQDPSGEEQRGSRMSLMTPEDALWEALQLDRLLPQGRTRRNLHLHRHAPAPGLSQVPAVSGACLILPAARYWTLGGMHERYFFGFDDVDLCLRHTRAGGGVYFEPAVSVTHQRTTSVANPVRMEAYKVVAATRYLWSNFPSPGKRAYIGVLLPLMIARAGLRSVLKLPNLLKVAHRRRELARQDLTDPA
jgi:hypothetical protein